jgi:DNA-damage-inducible protein J
MLLVRVVAERALPFEPLIPNAETVKAMQAARRGQLATAKSVKSLIAGLNADD